MSIEIISIIVLAALIFVSAARRLNDALYLLSIVLFVGGGAAVLLGDPLAACLLYTPDAADQTPLVHIYSAHII